jgi:phosphatidylglycerophosphate synthase
MFGAWLGHFLDRPLEPFAKRISLNPNVITVAGFLVTALGSLVIARHLRLGGFVIALGSLMDMFDGIVARTQGRETRFGAFLDSLLDRFADAFIFLGLAWCLGGTGDHSGALLALGTMVGAFVISYAKARAESLGQECETGIMERPERVVMVVFGAITGWIIPVLWIMLVLTYLTVLQRVYHVWRTLNRP